MGDLSTPPKVLGKGQFGTVYKAPGQRAMKEITVKIPALDKFPWEEFEEVTRELTVVHHIQAYQDRSPTEFFSDKIVRFFGTHVERQSDRIVVCLLMEQAACSLQDMFKASPNTINWSIDAICSDMKQAITFLHLKIGWIARDISPGNVLKRAAATGDVFLLADFGKARPLLSDFISEREIYSCDHHGAAPYQPPRAFLSVAQRRLCNSKFSWKCADWFGIGAVVLCACWPSRFWAVFESFQQNFLRFSLEGIEAILNDSVPLLPKVVANSVTLWIRRELEHVSPILLEAEKKRFKTAARYDGVHPYSVVSP